MYNLPVKAYYSLHELAEYLPVSYYRLREICQEYKIQSAGKTKAFRIHVCEVDRLLLIVAQEVRPKGDIIRDLLATVNPRTFKTA